MNLLDKEKKKEDNQGSYTLKTQISQKERLQLIEQENELKKTLQERKDRYHQFLALNFNYQQIILDAQRSLEQVKSKESSQLFKDEGILLQVTYNNKQSGENQESQLINRFKNNNNQNQIKNQKPAIHHSNNPNENIPNQKLPNNFCLSNFGFDFNPFLDISITKFNGITLHVLINDWILLNDDIYQLEVNQQSKIWQYHEISFHSTLWGQNAFRKSEKGLDENLCQIRGDLFLKNKNNSIKFKKICFMIPLVEDFEVVDNQNRQIVSLNRFIDIQHVDIDVTGAQHTKLLIDTLNKNTLTKAYIVICCWLKCEISFIVLNFLYGYETESLSINFPTSFKYFSRWVKELQSQFNRQQQMDFTNKKTRKYLKVQQFQVIYTRFIKGILKLIQNQQSLVFLDFSDLYVPTSLRESLFNGFNSINKNFSIQKLKLEGLDLAEDSLNSLQSLLGLECTLNCSEISLNNNPRLGDYCLSEIIRNLLRRYTMQQINHGNQNKDVPLQFLGLRNTGMTDVSFYDFCLAMSQIHLRNQEKFNKANPYFDYKCLLKLEFGDNYLTENSFSSFGRLIKDFNGISEVSFKGNKKMVIQKGNTFFQDVLQNHSLLFLDLQNIPISIDTYQNIENVLIYNTCIQDIRITTNPDIFQYMQESKVLQEYYYMDFDQVNNFNDLDHTQLLDYCNYSDEEDLKCEDKQFVDYR